MKKWLLVLSVFIMMKSGQEICFHDGYKCEPGAAILVIYYGADRIYLPWGAIKWYTNSEKVHKLLKQGN